MITVASTWLDPFAHCVALTSGLPVNPTDMFPEGEAATNAFHCLAVSVMFATFGVAGQSLAPVWKSVVEIVVPASVSVAYSVARLRSPIARIVSRTGQKVVPTPASVPDAVTW